MRHRAFCPRTALAAVAALAATLTLCPDSTALARGRGAPLAAAPVMPAHGAPAVIVRPVMPKPQIPPARLQRPPLAHATVGTHAVLGARAVMGTHAVSGARAVPGGHEGGRFPAPGSRQAAARWSLPLLVGTGWIVPAAPPSAQVITLAPITLAQSDKAGEPRRAPIAIGVYAARADRGCRAEEVRVDGANGERVITIVRC